ncbi:MAG: LysM peptidoglycan-binding domain-containing protein [Chloroflexota bacterium]
MQQTEVKPYVLFTIIILAIVLAIGVFLTVMYLQNRPPDTTRTVTVEGQEIVINPVPESEVFIVPQPTPESVQPTGGEPPPQIAATEPPPPPPTETPVPPTAVPDEYIFINHTVIGTDTLYSLSRQYNTSIPLMARFGISSAVMIVGNILPIPVANPGHCPGYRPIVVVQGDTPSGISARAGITLEEFGRINGLDANYSIYETQVVCIP